MKQMALLSAMLELEADSTPRGRILLGSDERARKGPVPKATNKRAKVKAARKARHRNT